MYVKQGRIAGQFCPAIRDTTFATTLYLQRALLITVRLGISAPE